MNDSVQVLVPDIGDLLVLDRDAESIFSGDFADFLVVCSTFCSVGGSVSLFEQFVNSGVAVTAVVVGADAGGCVHSSHECHIGGVGAAFGSDLEVASGNVGVDVFVCNEFNSDADFGPVLLDALCDLFMVAAGDVGIGDAVSSKFGNFMPLIRCSGG